MASQGNRHWLGLYNLSLHRTVAQPALFPNATNATYSHACLFVGLMDLLFYFFPQQSRMVAQAPSLTVRARAEVARLDARFLCQCHFVSLHYNSY